MDINRAKEIIESLAEGIDPNTGEVLPADNVCNSAEVVRAFYTILQELKIQNKRTPKNSGKSWSEEDDELLKTMFENGASKSELQKHFMRSRGSIDARLAKLGLIDEKFGYSGGQ